VGLFVLVVIGMAGLWCEYRKTTKRHFKKQTSLIWPFGCRREEEVLVTRLWDYEQLNCTTDDFTRPGAEVRSSSGMGV
jgi:hypothetical protein